MLKQLFRKKPSIGGEIAYYDLTDWWLSELSADEQETIKSRFDPLGGSGRTLIEGNISSSSQSATAFLFHLAGWFNKADDRHIARKILRKAESLIDPDIRVLDLHFLYHQKIEILYKDRANPEFYEAAIGACRDQIALAPKAAQAFHKEYATSPLPSHKGFTQLAIALEKERSFAEAIDTCRDAQKQRWAGDWEKRIERCSNKLSKA